jgi:hypothetical protein
VRERTDAFAAAAVGTLVHLAATPVDIEVAEVLLGLASYAADGV